MFCEKPLAVDYDDARAFVAEAGKRGAVNFPFASSLGVATLAKWIEDGLVGPLKSISIEVAFATWPRSWQVDAAAWLDAPAQGGFHPRGRLAFPVPVTPACGTPARPGIERLLPRTG